MPICKRDGFDNALSKNKEDTFHDNDEVFFCEVTREIFRDYEDYFRHVMVINSTVWQCEATGRENLTYAEALKSERRARKKMELFKDSLRPPVMLVIQHAKQSAIKALNSIVCKFLRRRFFLNEEVTSCHKSSTYISYTVVDVIPPGKNPVNPNEAYEQTEKLKYKLKRIGNPSTEITVPFENVRRQRLEFTAENLHMFIRNNVTRVDGILQPKPESYKQYVTDRKINFSSIFIGKMPHFTPAKIKRPPQETENSKKQSSMNKYLLKNGEEKNGKLNAQEIAKREKEKAEKAEAKAKSLKEEMERLRLEKQERLAEQERQRVEKRAKLMEKIDMECTALLTKTDDLERTDQRRLPDFKPLHTYIPIKLVGDAFMVREFMHSFAGVLSGIESSRGNLTFYELSRAFTIREVAGPLSDILQIFLSSVFDLQKEEEEECSVEYLLLRKELRKREPIITMSQAARAHFYSKRHFSFRINELPIDPLTLSEVLRLHLLSSGASVKDRAEKWRIMYRNGYASSEDPGLELRMRHPHILRALKMYTIYQLPFLDIMRILRCMMAQVLTYSSTINVIEERMEQMAKARFELKTISTTENRRLASIQAQKRTLTNEYHQQCMDKEVKSDVEKKRQLEEKLNKKVAELLAQSEREHKRYEQQVEKQNSALFNFLVFLGMDRAYRKYYVLESMPGIFVEHPVDCMDTCLSDPPQNSITSAVHANAASLPRTRKELRSYLLKMYTDEEKKATAKLNLKNGKTTDPVSQENKENQENGLLTNGLANGHDEAAAAMVNGVEKMEVESANKSAEEVVVTPAPPPTPPTQYQLFMCTGDPKNCIVHDERNADRQRWTFFYEKEDIDALIEALNPLGERESQLRDQLSVLRALIVNHVKKCPFDQLTMDTKQIAKFKHSMMSDTYRRYNKSNYGFPEGADLNEVMYSALVERVLQFESDIYTGDLGRLKVKDMVKWRENIQNNTYDAQVKLQWGPVMQKLSTTAAASNVEDAEELDDAAEGDEDELDVDVKDAGQYGSKPYRDPGEDLGDTMEIDSEDSSDESISLHDSNTLRTCVKSLASALLQVEQAIERRFLKEPFGAPLKDIKDKELLERKLKWGADRLKQWEVSLMESTSYSQVLLHLNVLHDSIIWSRSTNKSSCQVCRRGSDPDKMLLCDECNGGTHMFCMKPKMKSVPEGNWYCQRCVTRLGLKNEDKSKNKAPQKRKRTFIVDEEEKDDTSDTSSISAASSIKANERGRGRRVNKRMHSNEIEEVLQESEEEIEETEEVIVEEVAEEEQQEEGEASEVEATSTSDAEAESENHSEQEDDDNVCIVCSYDGGDLLCVRCKDSFHLECINLKRPPRYNFICTKCKAKEDKRRKAKSNSRFGDSSNSEDDESEDSDAAEPPAKRKRQSRGSLRNSNSNATSQEKSTNQRRSHRRTGDHLPLNSSALYELLEDIMKNEHSWPFLRPVLPSEVPDYYKIIKTPMDLAKVKSKLNMGAYQLNEEVMNDIQLIFNNCDHYNVKGNEIYQAGNALEKFVIERSKDLNLPFRPSDMNE